MIVDTGRGEDERRHMAETPRRQEGLQRVQIGLTGLAGVVLLVGLANIVIEKARMDDAALPPPVVPTLRPGARPPSPRARPRPTLPRPAAPAAPVANTPLSPAPPRSCPLASAPPPATARTPP